MNLKKKLYTAGLALTFCLATTTFALAAEGETNATGGAVFQVTDTNGGTGEVLSLSMSPGVVINAETQDNAFAFSCANANANANNRIEYAIWMAFSGYYQQTNASASVPFVSADMLYDGAAGDPATTTSPFAGWTAIGDDTGS